MYGTDNTFEKQNVFVLKLFTLLLPPSVSVRLNSNHMQCPQLQFLGCLSNLICNSFLFECNFDTGYN